MNTIAVPEHTIRRVVRRARFACTLYRLADENAVLAQIARHREAHWIGSSTCAAYVLDSGAIQRSDEGGKPILEALRNQGLTNVLAMMTVDFAGVDFVAAEVAHVYDAVASQAINEAGTASIDP